MKRSVLSAAILALSLGLSGCDGGGVQEGAPQDLTPAVPLDPKMVDMSGRMAKDMGKAQAKAADAAKAAPAATPEEKK